MSINQNKYMGIRTKALVTVLLVGTVLGVFIMETKNDSLFQGLIFGEKSAPQEEPVAKKLPDLTGTIETTAQAAESKDINIKATIKNTGEGNIENGETFKYAIFLNDTEVLSNSDSFSTLAPGDSFSFTYPISKEIYKYPETGKLKLVLDTENTVKESNESNNEIVIDYISEK